MARLNQPGTNRPPFGVPRYTETNMDLTLSEEEFERSMREIDEQLVSREAKLPGREIRGWIMFCQKYDLRRISLDAPISEKVTGWFKARYGDRLNLDFSLGHSVEIIRGDLLRSRCSVFYGEIHVVCHPAMMGQSTDGPVTRRAAFVNVLDRVDGMTASFGASLTPGEQQTLQRGYATSQLHLSRIGDLTPQPFIREARADLRESVEHMFRSDPQFGLSKWASLQAVEKHLKAYIRQKGEQPERNHFLEGLATEAERLSLQPIPREKLELAKCVPGARYGEIAVSRTEAVESYQAAVEISGTIALQLNAKSEWNTEIHPHEFMTSTEQGEKIPMIVMRRLKFSSPASN
jgi:HEPN domain-containing protein